jgi:hypothetical protein
MQDSHMVRNGVIFVGYALMIYCAWVICTFARLGASNYAPITRWYITLENWDFFLLPLMGCVAAAVGFFIAAARETKR